MSKEKRMALYARVSTQDQSPENQLLELRSFAKARGWTIAGEFVDRGVSGARESRPALDELMGLVRRRKVDGVLVFKLDRFARSVKQLVLALDEFNALGVDFVSLNESMDTTSPSGKLLFHVLSALSEFERSLIRERVVAGIARARKDGVRFGRPQRDPIDMDRAQDLIRNGQSVNRTAAIMGVPRTSLRMALGKKPTRNQAAFPLGRAIGD